MMIDIIKKGKKQNLNYKLGNGDCIMPPMLSTSEL